ncbi:MAG: hypothetical protein ACJATI_003590 [Halioglobus sp.]|jgi:hypothetical protein
MDDIQEGKWNLFNSSCRGLVLDLEKRKIIAFPFGKFTSYNSDPNAVDFIRNTSDELTLTKKYDGTMVVVFENDGEICCVSRKAFANFQIDATLNILERLQFKIEYLRNKTMVFEYISPENKIEIDYDEERIVLLGVRNIEDGSLLQHTELKQIGSETKLEVAEQINLNVTELIELAKNDDSDLFEEGWIIRSGSRLIKLKSWKYLYKIKSNRQGLTKKQIIDKYISLNEDGFESLKKSFANDEIRKAIDLLCDRIELKIDEVEQLLSTDFEVYNKIAEDKQFALDIQKSFDREKVSYLFALRKNRPLRPLIRKNIVNYIDFYTTECVIPISVNNRSAFNYED